MNKNVEDRKKSHGSLWTMLCCSRCRYVHEHPGPVTVGDLDKECALCRAPLGAVTVFRVSETVGHRLGSDVREV